MTPATPATPTMKPCGYELEVEGDLWRCVHWEHIDSPHWLVPVRRYDGGTQHADWCPDHDHDGRCLDRYLEGLGYGPTGG